MLALVTSIAVVALVFFTDTVTQQLQGTSINVVIDTFVKELAGTGLASWTKPNGGYFISLDTQQCSAMRVGELCKSLGVVLTSVGATYPYGKDPEDKNIRIAPTFPSVTDIGKAAEVLCLCIKLATIEKMM